MSEATPPAEALPPGQPAVHAQDAASLIVIRQGASGPETLMGMRGAKHRFMPNRLVFPGGKVDPGDFTGRIGTAMAPDAARRLAKASSDALAPALAHAAARELEEETGLVLGRPPAQGGPDLDGVDYLCRATTPAGQPIRFNARFLTVDAAHVGGTLAGSGELEELRYWAVADALALDLAFPTRGVLEQLQQWLALSPEERRARTRTPYLHNRVWLME